MNQHQCIIPEYSPYPYSFLISFGATVIGISKECWIWFWSFVLRLICNRVNPDLVLCCSQKSGSSDDAIKKSSTWGPLQHFWAPMGFVWMRTIGPDIWPSPNVFNASWRQELLWSAIRGWAEVRAFGKPRKPTTVIGGMGTPHNRGLAEEVQRTICGAWGGSHFEMCTEIHWSSTGGL